MINILDPEKEKRVTPLLRQAFRPFFLLGASFGSIAMLLWLAVLQGNSISFALPAMLWHAHEMVFGFGLAIIAGFLLTAVQNWTGQRGINGFSLLGLVLLWSLSRVINGVDLALPLSVITAAELGVFLMLIYTLARPLIRVRQYRNLIFVPILTAMAALDLTFYWMLYSGDILSALHAIKLAILLVIMLVVIIGGRVIPMFTANGTQTAKVTPSPTVERWAIGSYVLVVGFTLATLFVSQTDMSGVLSIAWFIVAASHSVRAIRWRPWVTYRVPLVWSLHAAYWCIPFGALGMALSYSTSLITHSTALHILTVGAMTGMILAMISRVSLGHSGRPLIINRVTVSALYCLSAAAIVRLVYGLWPDKTGLLLSGGLFILAFALYVLSYFNVLTTPRADGRPG
ncbi:heme-Cu protein NnrS [Veronia nyctiphanis]|uniref:Heme-Cu protein NnrS n=1 Tax=Veronia nyctiphanis TaxID=1278244 RepID=A0A4Q0YVF8_9GAMM|nr:NnrS family protein [Veronia nyctiphanis]RXJ74795.1 heme-Cu protein NnrS [Veronia nyctiphanis]